MSYEQFYEQLESVSKGDLDFREFVKGGVCREYLNTVHEGEGEWPVYLGIVGKWGGLVGNEFYEGNKSIKVRRMGNKKNAAQISPIINFCETEKGKVEYRFALGMNGKYSLSPVIIHWDSRWDQVEVHLLKDLCVKHYEFDVSKKTGEIVDIRKNCSSEFEKFGCDMAGIDNAARYGDWTRFNERILNQAMRTILKYIKNENVEHLHIKESFGYKNNDFVERFNEIIESKYKVEKDRDQNALKCVTALNDWMNRFEDYSPLRGIDDLSKYTTCCIENLSDFEGEIRDEGVLALGKIGKPAVELLIESLEEKNPKTKKYIARALGKIGDPRAVEPLIKYLGKNDKKMKRYTAWALGKIGDPRAFEPLVKCLKKDKDRDVRGYAAWALGKIGDPRAVEPLVKCLKKDKDRDVRGYAAWALGKIGDPRAVEPLVKCLKKDKYEVKRYAAGALGRIGDPRAFEPLVNILKSKYRIFNKNIKFSKNDDLKLFYDIALNKSSSNLNVKIAAAEALGAIGDLKAIEPLIECLETRYEGSDIQKYASKKFKKIKDYMVRGWLNQFAKESVEEVRNAAVGALGKIEDHRVIEELIERLHDRNEEVVVYAAKALGKIGDPRAFERLNYNLRNKDKKIKKATAKALGEIGNQRCLAPLVRGLITEDSNKEYIFEALKKVGEPELVEDLIEHSNKKNYLAEKYIDLKLEEPEHNIKTLIECLRDPNRDVSRGAGSRLRKIGEPVIEPLIECLNDKRYFGAKSNIVSILGDSRDPRVVEPLIESLKDKGLLVYMSRACAAVKLGQLGDPRAVEGLVELLKDRDWFVKCSAATALGKIGEPSAIGPLIKKLKDPNESVQDSAERALKDMLGTEKYEELKNNQWDYTKLNLAN